MENWRGTARVVTYLAAILMVSKVLMVEGQTYVGCTPAMLTSFAPCMSYLTGGGGSPTAACCQAFGALVSTSTDCSCLILTGGAPLNVPFSRQLAVSLPGTCRSTSPIPLFQCKGTNPLSGFTSGLLPTVSPGPTSVESPADATALSPAELAPAIEGVKPQLVANTVVKLQEKSAISVALLVMALMLLLGKF